MSEENRPAELTEFRSSDAYISVWGITSDLTEAHNLSPEPTFTSRTYLSGGPDRVEYLRRDMPLLKETLIVYRAPDGNLYARKPGGMPYRCDQQGNNLEKTQDPRVVDIMDNFDFDDLFRIMDLTGHTWCGKPVSVGDLKHKALEMFRDILENPEVSARFCGGLVAREDDDNTLSLSYVPVDWVSSKG